MATARLAPNSIMTETKVARRRTHARRLEPDRDPDAASAPSSRSR